LKFLLFADCARPETAKAIAHFMIRQELIGDVDRGGNDYRQHPAIWPWRELLAKLRSDAISIGGYIASSVPTPPDESGWHAKAYVSMSVYWTFVGYREGRIQ